MWNRSLYWRIGVGFVLLIAGMLASQGAVFLWLLNRSEAAGAQLLEATRGASAQLGTAMAGNPALDVDAYLSAIDAGQPLFAIMIDGRVIGSRPSDAIYRLVVDEFQRSGDVPAIWESSAYHATPIVVRGRIAGLLGVLPESTLKRFGPQMALVGFTLLVAGTALAALLIGGPVRRRLGELGHAARRVGSGDLTARAKVGGDDELAEFVRTFNAMAAQLETRANQLQASDQARSQLVADVSHELMTPMTAIRGHLETLAMDDVHLEAATRKRFVAVMMRETQRLERLIGDLLDVARLEAGGEKLDLQTVLIEDVFDAVVEHHERECRTREIQLTSYVAPEAEALTGDPFRLEQAVDNLTANALRHTQDGGTIALRAELTTKTDSNEPAVRLTVTDSGEGIPPEEVLLVFDRFYKAKSGQRGPSGGSGLGLSIVKAIVERHGGRVSASSVLGEGTTIALDLPVGSVNQQSSGDRAAREPV